MRVVIGGTSGLPLSSRRRGFRDETLGIAPAQRSDQKIAIVPRSLNRHPPRLVRSANLSHFLAVARDDAHTLV
jgi:hypothetical protein